jgi:hypothetical protein
MTWSGNGLVMTALQWYACDDWGSGGARTAIKNRALRCRYQAGWHLARSSVAHRRIVLRNEDKKRSGGRPCFTAPSAATRVQPGNIRRDISVAGVVSIVAWPTSPSHDRPSIERQLSAALSSDRRGVGGEGDHWPAMEQPDQADGVEAEEAAVGRVGQLRQGRQAEQILDAPSQRIGLVSPAGEKPATVLDRVLPINNIDMVGTAAFEGRESRRNGGWGPSDPLFLPFDTLTLWTVLTLWTDEGDRLP